MCIRWVATSDPGRALGRMRLGLANGRADLMRTMRCETGDSKT